MDSVVPGGEPPVENEMHYKCRLCEKWIDDYGAAISFGMGRQEDGAPKIEVSKYFNVDDDLRICHECIVELRKSVEIGYAIEESKKEVARLRDLIDQTVDGKLVPDCEEFFCPQCRGKVKRGYKMCYCDECTNPDADIPHLSRLALFHTQCYSKGVEDEE